MADYWTWARIKAKVRRDLDLEAETFINEEELLGYANEAIDEVERQIHTLYEDYFLTRADLTLVSGQEEYDLPADIYAMKIRALVYRKDTSVWKIHRIRDWYKFEQYEVEKTGIQNYVQYGYFITNASAGTPKILLAPTPNENGSFVKVWYIRNANALSVDTDICDIPEAVNYIMQYIKVRCMEKELHPALPKAVQDLEVEKQTTVAVLSQMTPDSENEIEPDFRLYEDMA